MKDSRNLLILLGFICQGFAWDNYFIPLIFAVLWFFCLRLSGEKQFISEELEFLLFFCALLLSFKFGGIGFFNKSLSMGNGLMVLQVMRMLWPLDKRKKYFSVAIALTQLAIGSQAIVEYYFILILIGAVILIPRTLYELELESYHAPHIPFGILNGKIEYLTIIFVMVLFFIFFPRIQVLRRETGGLITAISGPIKPRMEMSGGGGLASPEKTLFQIQGTDIGYLKSYSLDTFDGNTWTASDFSFAVKRRFSGYSLDDIYRKVTVKDPEFLGLVLPTDGYVVNIKGNFFQDAYISAQGNVMVSLIWPANNNVYEYWMKEGNDKSLNKRERERYTMLPARQSLNLAQWLDEVLHGEKDPYKQTIKIEQYLRKNFIYEIGSPDLNRLNPVEDFIFNQKKGHCERFASALALLLRMKGIPSRVAVGYYPSEKNQFAEFYNVKGKHGHAWTEAYIPGRGWMTFDSTPYKAGSLEAFKSLSLSIYDWIEYVWYSKIVNFSVSDQKVFFLSTLSGLKGMVNVIPRHLIFLIIMLFLLPVFVSLCWNRLKGLFDLFAGNASKSVQVKKAGHFYGRMLEELMKNEIYRNSSQTPFEFLREVEKRNYPMMEEVIFITETFCLVKYGGMDLSQRLCGEIENAIKSITKENKLYRDNISP